MEQEFSRSVSLLNAEHGLELDLPRSGHKEWDVIVVDGPLGTGAAENIAAEERRVGSKASLYGIEAGGAQEAP